MPYLQQPSSALFSSNTQQYPYILYELDEEYEYKDGSLAIPVAGQGLQPSGQRQAQEIVQLSSPFSRRIVRFQIARLNSPCVVPQPKARTNENMSYIKINTKAPKLWTDGVSRVYRIEGIYIYDNFQPVIPGTDTLQLGSSDADATPPSAYTLGPSDFSPRD